MFSNSLRLVRSAFIVLTLFASGSAWATQVRFETPVGGFTVDLFEDVAPVTVANFLEYVESGAYENSFIHRKVPGFVIQGGGYTFTDEAPFELVPTLAPIVNESQVSNTRGTLAMARTEDPDSATSQWFINLVDNSEALDGDTETGYAVFGEVVGDGMDVVDVLGSIQTWNFNPLGNLPLLVFGGGADEEVTERNFLYTDIRVLADDPPFIMNAGLNGGWGIAGTTAQGLYLDVLPDKGLVSFGWYTWDTALPAGDAMAEIGDPGNRWLTALSGPNALAAGGPVTLDVFAFEGDLFDTPADMVNVEQASVGTVTLEFTDCESGHLEYDLTAYGLSGSFDLARVANDNVALCQELAESAYLNQ